MGLLQKIIAGGPYNKTRLHSQDGDLLDLAGLMYLPQCAASTFGRLLFGWRPSVPWLGYRAVRHLDTFLQPDWDMIEYGSGMSTVWFAKRVKHVYSIEDNAQWYQKVSAKLDRLDVKNITYKLLEGPDYSSAEFLEDGSMDFVLVDGSVRDACMQTAVRKIKPGGWIYLDNCDQRSNDRKVARKLLLEQIETHGGSHEYFVDLHPTYLGVTKALLAQVGIPVGDDSTR